MTNLAFDTITRVEEIVTDVLAMDLLHSSPGLGEITSSTSEYTRMMLDSYAEYGSFPERKVEAP